MSDEPQEGALGAEDTASHADEAPQLTETEQLASEMGWRPEADYSGAAPWKPARDFILTEREISRETKKSVKHLREQVDRMAAASTKATERALLAQADELNRRFTEAVEAKDTKGAAAAAKDMRDLEASARAETAPDPEAIERDFSAENPWYGKDAEATEYAQFVSQRELAKGIPFSQHKDTVTAAVRKRFPELAPAGTVARKDPPSLHAPGSGARRAKEKGFADLPANVKAAAESHARLASSRFGVDAEKAKADYARDYFADAAA